ncbi:MAG: S8 family serine peptidase [Clostridia bacterium]|nr:S8 family serine peptidase [Clostridia bacterium]
MSKIIRRIFAAFIAAAMLFALTGSITPAAGAVTEAIPGAQHAEKCYEDPGETVNIIVKLADAPVLARCGIGEARAAELGAELKSRQDAVIAAINSRLAKDAPIEPLYRYTLLFNGFAFRGECGLISGIKKLPGVADCFESRSFILPEKVEGEGEQERLGTSVGLINADDMWALGYTGQGMTIAVIDTGILVSHPAFAQTPEQPHFDITSLDAVLADNELCAEQRYTGPGALTAGDLYKSGKIPFGFNYFAGNTDVSHTYAENDHGTHVSSIAAGNSAGAKGVAFNAQLIAMQVFNGGSADWIDIVAALEDCAYLGVDAVNMSLSADCGFTEDEDLEQVFTLLSAHGVNVAAASGNSGTAGSGNIFNGTTPTFNYDNGVTSTPACMRGAISVAASLDSADCTPASYSSWGSTSDLRIKPELMAPGDNIEAAVDPEYSGSYYDIKSGTSMATPHIAGGMALVKQYVRANFPELSPEETMEMVNTLLMCTAVPSASGGVLFSPRQQGAGRADLTAAIATKAYISVPGEAKPKLELGDDDEKTGVFTFSFDVVNFGDESLTYTVDTRVLTEEINVWLIGLQLVNIMNHTPLDITANCTVTAPQSVTVPAGGRTTVDITVDVSPYAPTLDATCPNGMYIDGFVQLHGAVDLSVPFLGFYGDWEYGAIFDRKNYYDQYLGTTQPYPNEWGTNRAAAEMDGATVLFGMNPFTDTTNFLLDRASLSPNGDGKLDEIAFVHTYMLRNTETFRYEVVDAETGEQYFVQELYLVPKAVRNSYTSFYQPVGAEPWSAIEHWGGAELPNGTHCILRMTGYLQGTEPFDPYANENAVWEVPITVDTEAPQLAASSLAGGTLALTVSDNHYTAYVGVYQDAACTALIAERGVFESERGAETALTFSVGSREKVYVKIGDYAGNTAVFEVGSTPSYLKGDCDLNGTVNVADAVLALRHSMGLITLTGDGFLAGDIDENGTVAVTDAIAILRYSMGLIPEL